MFVPLQILCLGPLVRICSFVLCYLHRCIVRQQFLKTRVEVFFSLLPLISYCIFARHEGGKLVRVLLKIE